MKKLRLVFFILCMIFLTSCGTNSKLEKKHIEYTQKNIQFSLLYVKYEITTKFVKSPLTIEVSTENEDFLLNIIYLKSRGTNGEYENISFVYKDYKLLGSLEELFAETSAKKGMLFPECINDLKIAAEIEQKYDPENIIYEDSNYTATYHLIPESSLSISPNILQKGLVLF